MTDPKDDHTVRYTTTPPDDRVGSLDRTDTPDIMPDDPQEVPQFTDKGTSSPAVTRDPEAMEHQLQGAQYAGADPPAPLSGDVPNETLGWGAGNVGINPGPLRDPLRDADQNPGYVPPSEDGPAELREQPGDLAQGEPTQERLDEAVRDHVGDRDRER